VAGSWIRFYPLLQEFEVPGMSVKFNVSYVANRAAFEWFLHHGFQDWDGMGEELGKGNILLMVCGSQHAMGRWTVCNVILEIHVFFILSAHCYESIDTN
jgi:hypothetical protein